MVLRSRLIPAFVLVLAACGSGASGTTAPPPPPVATDGWLTLQLSSPTGNDGAVQFAVTGPGIDSITIIGYDGFSAMDNGVANLLVTGEISNGDIARIHVPDVSLTLRYHATIAAAAARGNYNLQPLDGYRATLVR